MARLLHRSGAAVAVASLLGLVAGPLRADEATSARAQALFEEGRTAFEQRDFEHACTKLAESARLEASVGTLGLLASCHDEQGRTATAWHEYVTAADLATQRGDARGAYARQRATELEPRLPKLVIRLERAGASVAVDIDGDAIAREHFGETLPVDPGVHTIGARAPGKPPFYADVRAEPGRVSVITIPDLLGAATAPNAVSTDATPHGSNGQKGARIPIAVAAFGVGVAASGIGLWLAGSAIAKNRASESIHDTCTSAGECASGHDLRVDAQHEANAAGVLLGVGLAAVATGSIVLLTGPSRERSKTTTSIRPVVSPKGAALAVGRSFQ